MVITQVAVVRFRFEGLQKLLELRKPINEEDVAAIEGPVGMTEKRGGCNLKWNKECQPEER